MRRIARLSLLIVVLACAACIPATPPPHLTDTAAPPVIIAGDVISTSAFTLTQPGGWRVITSAANEAPTITLVSPDECALIRVSTHLFTLPDLSCEGAQRTHMEQIGALHVGLSAPSDDWLHYRAIYDETVHLMAP